MRQRGGGPRDQTSEAESSRGREGKGDKRGQGRHYPPVAAGGVDLGELRLRLRLRRGGRHRGGEGGADGGSGGSLPFWGRRG